MFLEINLNSNRSKKEIICVNLALYVNYFEKLKDTYLNIYLINFNLKSGSAETSFGSVEFKTEEERDALYDELCKKLS